MVGPVPNRIPPGLVVICLLILITSQLLYAGWPQRPRRYPQVLVLTGLGFILGECWNLIGLPALRVGEANLLPALIFAVALQPLARFVPLVPRRRR